MLFRMYSSHIGIDLAFQDFETELTSLPGKYAPPAGAVFLARDAEGGPVGCVGLRPLGEPGICELKRLFVLSSERGTGLGSQLVEAAISFARRLGYQEIRLDTLRTMGPAIALYRRHGFVPTEAYYETPLADTLFMRLLLPRDADPKTPGISDPDLRDA
jgi:GNAT superfamily N-acetyltransferase